MQPIMDIPRYVCTACGLISWRNSKPCAGALIVRDDHLLLTRRGIEPHRDCWDIPGGFLEYGEEPEVGMRRELQEELGLDVEIDSLLGIYMDDYGTDGASILVIMYVCTALHEPAYSADDIVEYRWFPLDDLPTNLGFTSSQRAIEALLAMERVSGF